MEEDLMEGNYYEDLYGHELNQDPGKEAGDDSDTDRWDDLHFGWPRSVVEERCDMTVEELYELD